MSTYELTFMTTDKDSTGFHKAQDLIIHAGGTIAVQNSLGKRNFSYPIKGLTSGYYHVWNIEYPEQKLLEFKQKLQLNEDIIRYLILKKK